MKTTKRFATLIITLALILGTVTIPAFAAGMPFTDVKSGDWYYNHVQYVYDNGIMSGVSGTEFAPSISITRGMLVTMLHRLAGTPAPSATTGFPDVPANAWYFKAVYWAKENKVVSGYPDGTFAPDKPITRAELVVVLYGYAKNVEGKDVSNGKELTFADTADIGGWAQAAVSWAVANKIVSGKPGNIFDPGAGATRAEGATILHQYSAPSGATTPPTDYSAYEFPYDIPAIIEDAKAYGATLGMTWSDEMTIDNSSWETPSGTSASSYSGALLKEAIEVRIRRIKQLNIDDGFGDDETWHFRVLFVSRDGYPGEYTIYFLM
jgi:hypothetical protein